jgi:hypothetical protein
MIHKNTPIPAKPPAAHPQDRGKEQIRDVTDPNMPDTNMSVTMDG